MKKIVLAADLGGTNLRLAAVDREGNILHRIKEATPRAENGSKIVEVFVRAAQECTDILDDVEIVAIASAVPSTVDVTRGVLVNTPNLPELEGFEIVKAVEDRLGITAVLENDANAAAIGENWMGASRGYDNSIMVTLGTGVGGGMILNGEIYRGVDGTAGEIGHICVVPEGAVCGCGSRGCVEQYASASAVLRMAREIGIENRSELFGDASSFTSEDVYRHGVSGDPIAVEVFRRQGYYLGIALAGLVNVLNPEVIVLGGGAAAGWNLFIESLRTQIDFGAYPKPALRAKLVRAKLGDDAGILGVSCPGFGNTQRNNS